MHFLVLLSALVACVAGVPFNTAKPKQDGRIVGGNPAPIENHPHQVALLYDGEFSCSGSIVCPNCVVTTAHCVKGMHPERITIRAGSTHHEFGGVTHKVTGGFYHGGYDEYTHVNDVAVLRVEPPFTYSDTVQNIILEDSEISTGTNVVVTGWGSTSTDGPPNPNLLEALVRIKDDATCNDTYSGGITETMICAGGHSGFIGPCFGDSGGPLSTLFCPRRLVGIIAMGPSDCGHPDFPGIYTKISAVRTWITHLCSAQIIPKGITKADAIP